MLKPEVSSEKVVRYRAAAFGRLCVETDERYSEYVKKAAAAFGRLCVETQYSAILSAT